MADYTKIGSCFKVNNDFYFKFGFSGTGMCFKDEEAYANDWEAPCYVPESARDSEYPEYDSAIYYYSHNDLLAMCNFNEEMCDAMFDSLSWVSPGVWLDELDEEDVQYFYRFVRSGSKVFWMDPDWGLSSGEYEVIAGPFDLENDDVMWDFDNIVHVTDGYSVAEVYLSELIPLQSLENQKLREMIRNIKS